MRAPPNKPSLIKHQNEIAVTYGTYALGNNHLRNAREVMGKRMAQCGISGKVERRGGVIEHKNLWRTRKRAGDRKPLALATGKVTSLLLHYALNPTLDANNV